MKLFTLEEAEDLLPRIRERLAAMQACKREVDAIRDYLEHAVSSTAGNGHVRDENTLAEKRRAAESLVEEINAGLRVLNDWGVELKGLDEGLIDFPSEREGRVVCLCWRMGEQTIAWWHEIDTGFGHRQPL
jgi:hypothetical protein